MNSSNIIQYAMTDTFSFSLTRSLNLLKFGCRLRIKMLDLIQFILLVILNRKCLKFILSVCCSYFVIELLKKQRIHLIMFMRIHSS
jgi:hypothetical protein